MWEGEGGDSLVYTQAAWEEKGGLVLTVCTCAAGSTINCNVYVDCPRTITYHG